MLSTSDYKFHSFNVSNWIIKKTKVVYLCSYLVNLLTDKQTDKSVICLYSRWYVGLCKSNTFTRSKQHFLLLTYLNMSSVLYLYEQHDRCYMLCRICLPVCGTWDYPGILVGVCVTQSWVFYVMFFCAFVYLFGPF